MSLLKPKLYGWPHISVGTANKLTSNKEYDLAGKLNSSRWNTIRMH